MTARVGGLALRLLTAAALVVDAVVHFQMAGTYTYAGSGGWLNEGTLFRAEATVAILAALLVLTLGNRLAYAVALLVAASAFAAVMLYRYVDVPAIGPLPSMYEPIWYAQKTLSAVAEGIGALLAAAGFLRQRKPAAPAGDVRQPSRMRA
jgi:hypothetical protein